MGTLDGVTWSGDMHVHDYTTLLTLPHPEFVSAVIQNLNSLGFLLCLPRRAGHRIIKCSPWKFEEKRQESHHSSD